VIELIEVPGYLLPPSKTVDLSKPLNIHLTGLNHFSFDVTMNAKKEGGLSAFLQSLNSKSESRFDRSVRLVLEPYVQIIGRDVYEIGFVADPDGVLLELISLNGTLHHEMTTGW
jgi:hypothetical protein